MSDIATTIRAARVAAPMSQEQLAIAAGLSRKTVSRIEGGETPSAETLLALCSVLRLDASELAPDLPSSAREVLPTAGELAAMATWPHDTPERKAVIADLARVAALKVPGARAMVTVDLDAFTEWFDRSVAYRPGKMPSVRNPVALTRRASMIKIATVSAFVVAVTVGAVAVTAMFPGFAVAMTTLWHREPVEVVLVICMVASLLYGSCGVAVHLASRRCLWEAKAVKTSLKAVESVRNRSFVMGEGGIHVLDLRGDSAAISRIDASYVNIFYRKINSQHANYNMRTKDFKYEDIVIDYWISMLYRLKVRSDEFDINFVQASKEFDSGMDLYEDRTHPRPERFRLSEIQASSASA